MGVYDDNSAMYVKMLFISSKTLDEIADALVSNNIAIKIFDLKQNDLLKLLDDTKPAAFKIIYDLFEDKDKFVHVHINDEPIIFYLVKTQKKNILNEILHDIVHYKSSINSSWCGANVMHMLCYYHYYNLIIKLHKLDNELISTPDACGYTPFDLLLIKTAKQTIICGDLVKIIKMIDIDIYQKLLNNKIMNSSKHNYRFGSILNDPIGLNFIDIIERNISSSNNNDEQQKRGLYQTIMKHICDVMMPLKIELKNN